MKHFLINILLVFPHLCQEKFQSSKLLVVDWLQNWLFTDSYVYLLCHKTLLYLPSIDVPVPWVKLSRDLLRPIKWGRSIGIPGPHLGFKWPWVSTLFLPPLCEQAQATAAKWWEAFHLDTQLTASKLPACEWGHPKPVSPHLPPDRWLTSKPSRDQTGLGHLSRTCQLICWLVSNNKSLLASVTTFLRWLVTEQEPTVTAHTDLPLLLLWCSYFFVSATLCSNHYVNFPTALQMQNPCLAYPAPTSPILPFQQTPLAVLLLLGDSSQAPPSPGSIPRTPFSTPLPTFCWEPLLLLAADSPYLSLCHSTYPKLKSSVYPAIHSCCTVNSVEVEILSFICYSSKWYNSSQVAGVP